MSSCEPTQPGVLIVDDEVRAIEVCEFILESAGILNTIACSDSREAIGILETHQVGVVILDLNMPYMSGQAVLEIVTSRWPDLPVVVFTGANDVETAVACMRAGAFDYMVKPADETRLVTTVQRALDLAELRREYATFKNRVLTGGLEHPEAFEDILTNNGQMRSVFQYVEAIARTDRPVLVTGESGVGKELIARAVHRISGRSGEMVAVNAAGLDDGMFSDALFGHTKGAFTGADDVRAGLVERAARGTLFLDEIGDLAAASQVKLLRLLQEREYMPLGSDVPRESEARVVVATNLDLAARVADGAFRADLLYRLQTHEVRIPSLRERLDDLPLLVEHFLERAAESMEKRKPTVPPQLYHLLGTYRFPGNVRELEAMVFEAVAHHESKVLSTERFRAHMDRQEARDGVTVEGSGGTVIPKDTVSPFAFFERLPTLKEAPRMLMEEAMKRADGNQAVAARMLGITPSGLSKAIRRAGLGEEREGG